MLLVANGVVVPRVDVGGVVVGRVVVAKKQIKS